MRPFASPDDSPRWWWDGDHWHRETWDGNKWRDEIVRPYLGSGRPELVGPYLQEKENTA